VRVNLSGVEAGFDVIPAGNYLVGATNGEVRTSGENAKHVGAEYIAWELTIQEGDYEGRKQWFNTPISHGSCECDNWTSNSFIGIKSLLTATGMYTKEQLESDDFDFEIDDILGSIFIAVVVIGKYQGEDSNNVKRVKAPSEVSADASLLP
jgi:hypothetical protein